MKKKNQVLQKKYNEGYEKGYKLGFKIGIEVGRMQTVNYFAMKFDKLDEVKGIGPKVIDKFIEHFGREFFEVVKDNKNANK